MGKARNRSKQDNSSHNKHAEPTPNKNNAKSIRITTPSTPIYSKIISDWVYEERYGLTWITSCVLLGFLLGLSIGTGYITGAYGIQSIWRQTLANRIRSCYWYHITNHFILLTKYTIQNIPPSKVALRIINYKKKKDSLMKQQRSTIISIET